MAMRERAASSTVVLVIFDVRRPRGGGRGAGHRGAQAADPEGRVIYTQVSSKGGSGPTSRLMRLAHDATA